MPGRSSVGIDRRWNDPAIWSVLKQQSGRVTDFYYLAAFDMRRGGDGAVERAPEQDRLFLGLFGRTLGISVTVTLLCLLIGYPAAHLLATAAPRHVPYLLILVLLPFWTPILVRTTAWIVLLQNEGLVNRLLRAAGLIDHPLPLFGKPFLRPAGDGAGVAALHDLAALRRDEDGAAGADAGGQQPGGQSLAWLPARLPAADQAGGRRRIADRVHPWRSATTSPRCWSAARATR